MLPIDPVTIGSLLILAASPASELCQMPKPASINVRPRASKTQYDYSQTLEQLASTEIDTINPYGFDSISHTNGYMKGRIAMKPYVKVDYKHYPKYGAVCLWYDTVNLDIQIDPTIVIAKEVAKDKCMLNAVREHELKHVRVDREIVNKYAKTMGKKLHDGLKQRGFLVGPVRQEDAQAIVTRMQETVGQLVEMEYKKMEIKRAERQQAVDSLEEYTRVSNECPNYKSPASASRHRH